MQGYPYVHGIAIEWGGRLLRDTLAVTMKNKHDRELLQYVLTSWKLYEESW